MDSFLVRIKPHAVLCASVMPFPYKMAELITLYSQRPDSFFRPDGSPQSASEIIGRVSGFIRAVEPDVNLEREPALTGGLRPDVVISSGGDTLIMEIKRMSDKSVDRSLLSKQLLSYMLAAGVKEGLLLAPPTHPSAAMGSSVDVYEDPAGSFVYVVVISEELRDGAP